jgi:DNA-binding PadR family transcriptional regulator
LSEEDPCNELRARFSRSFLDAVVLRMLIREPLWGYRMMTMLREDLGVTVGPPVIYPLLDSMEKDGLIEGRDAYAGKRRRKTYSPTQKGIEFLSCLGKILSEMAV